MYNGITITTTTNNNNNNNIFVLCIYIVVRAINNKFPKSAALTILMVPAMLLIGLMPAPILGSVKDLTYTSTTPKAIGSDTKTSSPSLESRLM